MSDTRERARELVEDLTDSLYCGAGDEWKHKLDAGKIQTALESEAAQARKQERLECAKAMCYECRKGDVPERRMYSQPPSPFWIHTMLGFDDRNEDCGAGAIHERNLVETGG